MWKKILHMRNVKKIYGKRGEIMCTMYGVLSHFMLFCSRISFFVIYAVLSRNIYLAIHALLRGEKFNKKNCARGEKMTNMRYDPRRRMRMARMTKAMPSRRRTEVEAPASVTLAPCCCPPLLSWLFLMSTFTAHFLLRMVQPGQALPCPLRPRCNVNLAWVLGYCYPSQVPGTGVLGQSVAY